MYKLYKDIITGKNVSVTKTNEDGSVMSIPFDPANTYYQTYLKWVAEGNEPLPADDNGQTA